MAHALLLTARGTQGSRQTSVVLGLRVAAVVLALVVAAASGVGAANVAVGADGDAAPDVPLGLRLRSENGRFFVTQVGFTVAHSTCLAATPRCVLVSDPRACSGCVWGSCHAHRVPPAT